MEPTQTVRPAARPGRTRPSVPVAVVAIAVVALASLICARPAEAGPAATRTYIVGIRPDVAPDVIADERARRRNVSVRARLRAAFGGFVASMSDDEAGDLRRDPRITFVEPDAVLQTRAQVISTGAGRVGLLANPRIGVDGGADGAPGVDVDVAVVDTGVDLDHPDLEVVAGVTCVGGWCRSGGDDDGGHGTHVAGILAARDNDDGVVGVAPGARIVPVKILSGNGYGTVSDAVAGLDWVASRSPRVEVVNLSLGGTGRSSALATAVNNLVNRGIVVVVAAGNNTRDAGAYMPANMPDVITVSALADYDGQPGGLRSTPVACWGQGRDDRSASFSNYGQVIDVAAPGACIVSLRPGGRSTAMMFGTSMAAPHVAGAAAVLASQRTLRDRADVLAVADVIRRSGSTDWTDTSRDRVQEPRLDVSDASVFDPVLVGEPSVL